MIKPGHPKCDTSCRDSMNECSFTSTLTKDNITEYFFS